MRRSAFFAILLLACGGPEPRYGEAALSEAAPRVALTGTTFGQAAALELAPGCPGYLDVETPGHLVEVTGETPFTVRVRSSDGPLALAVARGDEVRCDSDEGSGHAPSLAYEGAGEYAIYVAALREPAALAYELELFTDGADAAPVVAQGDARDVSVTITSDPPGAQVADPGGQVVGTTPAMFVLSVPPSEAGQERTWTLSLPEHEEVRVTGTVTEGALVLHGQLTPIGPTVVDVSAEESQPIRDYQSAALAVEVAEACAITEAELGVDIRHTFVGDLRIVLRTPWSEDLVLQRHQGGGRRNLRRTWDLDDRQLSSLRGRSTRGRWTMIVHDDAGADQGSFERFDVHLVCAPGGVAVAPTPSEATPTQVVSPSPSPSPSPSGPIPDLPPRTEIVRVMSGLRPQVEQCGRQGGNVRVLATVDGSSGRVTRVNGSGTAPAPERACVLRAVRRARFSRFRRSELDVDYTYDLPRRGPAQGDVLNPWN